MGASSYAVVLRWRLSCALHALSGEHDYNTAVSRMGLVPSSGNKTRSGRWFGNSAIYKAKFPMVNLAS